MVGVPRFELGSKRPKRPSIGQTNPYARYPWPRGLTYELHSRNCQRPSPVRSTNPSCSARSIRPSASISACFEARIELTVMRPTELSSSHRRRTRSIKTFGEGAWGWSNNNSFPDNFSRKASLRGSGVLARATSIRSSDEEDARKHTSAPSPMRWPQCGHRPETERWPKHNWQPGHRITSQVCSLIVHHFREYR